MFQTQTILQTPPNAANTPNTKNFGPADVSENEQNTNTVNLAVFEYEHPTFFVFGSGAAVWEILLSSVLQM